MASWTATDWLRLQLVLRTGRAPLAALARHGPPTAGSTAAALRSTRAPRGDEEWRAVLASRCAAALCECSMVGVCELLAAVLACKCGFAAVVIRFLTVFSPRRRCFGCSSLLHPALDGGGDHRQGPGQGRRRVRLPPVNPTTPIFKATSQLAQPLYITRMRWLAATGHLLVLRPPAPPVANDPVSGGERAGRRAADAKPSRGVAAQPYDARRC